MASFVSDNFGEAIKRLATAMGRSLRRVRNLEGAAKRRVPLTFRGVIVAAGPDGEADYEDHRYWVRRARTANLDGSSLEPLRWEGWPDSFDEDNQLPAGVVRTPLSVGALRPKIVRVTNVAEATGTQEADDGAVGNHALPVGRLVTVYLDRGKDGTPRYWMNEVPIEPILVTVNGSSDAVSLGSGVWKYSWAELEPDTTEPLGNLVGKANGRTGTLNALNLHEVSGFTGSRGPLPPGTHAILIPRRFGSTGYHYLTSAINMRGTDFLVQVREDGSGVAGDDLTDCTFKYDIWRLDQDPATDTPIGTGLSPYKPRFPKTTYTKAGDDTFGMASYDMGGLTLIEAFKEFPEESVCT